MLRREWHKQGQRLAAENVLIGSDIQQQNSVFLDFLLLVLSCLFPTQVNYMTNVKVRYSRL